MALLDCLPQCLDWRMLLLVTLMLRATDRIRDTARQMSALALCSRHECCWHTHQRRERGERNGVSTEEKMDGTQKGGERKENREKEDNRRGAGVSSEIRWDLLCHAAVRQQPVWSESDAASLDIPQAVSLTRADPREEQETSHALRCHECSCSKVSSAQAGSRLGQYLFFHTVILSWHFTRVYGTWRYLWRGGRGGWLRGTVLTCKKGPWKVLSIVLERV